MEGDCQGRLKEGKRLTERKSVTRDEGRKEAGGETSEESRKTC